MILKEPGDNRYDLEALEALKAHPAADARTRQRITDEIRNINAGRAGESTAAYEMKVYLGASKNWIVIHDLRLEHDDLTTQIDHLLINRLLEIYVCESRSFANGIIINEFGEFMTTYDRRRHGVASPIEQNRRHIRLLESLIGSGALNLPKRLGMTIKPNIKSLVLIAKGSIERPVKAFAGLEAVIKADQLSSRLNALNDESNPLTLGRLISSETLADIGRQIVGLHRPKKFDWAAKFGLSPVTDALPNVATTVAPSLHQAREAAPPFTCVTCAVPVSRAVANYCRTNSKRFNGAIYCMSCQTQFPV